MVPSRGEWIWDIFCRGVSQLFEHPGKVLETSRKDRFWAPRVCGRRFGESQIENHFVFASFRSSLGFDLTPTNLEKCYIRMAQPPPYVTFVTYLCRSAPTYTHEARTQPVANGYRAAYHDTNAASSTSNRQPKHKTHKSERGL